MAITIFLQNEIFTKFLFPFLLIFFIVFAILEKTKLFGEGKKQINALLAFVLGLIFITAAYPKLVVENLILFLTISLVAVFVILLIWGFIFADKEGFKAEKWMKWILGVLFGVAFIVAIFWATGWYQSLSGFFSESLFSQTIVINVVFIIVIAIALALILTEKKASK